MLGIIVLVVFMALGAVQAASLFEERSGVIKLWLGMVLGLMEMMWLPSVNAYIFDFTMAAQIAALTEALLVTVFAVFIRQIRPKKLCENKKSGPDAMFILAVIFPAVVVTAFLQYTHTFVSVDGALHVGQSTYGDLCMHAGFATGLIGQSYPPEYTLLPGTKLGYPFLVDALSSTMLIFGTPLAPSIYVPGIVMCALFYAGFVIFAYELTGKKSAAAIAFFLFFFSGGLGFTRLFDENGLNEWAVSETLFGYYRTPTNLPEENLRWVNALCDLLIPQRTLMAGWMCLMPCLYLLVKGMRERKIRTFFILGVWAGALPMIHTHSFLALGAVSLGALVYTIVFERDKWNTTKLFGAYGIVACMTAAYQLLEWTFPQTIDGGSLRVYFNWVNNTGIGGLRDNYLWFWIKNVGVMFVVFPIAAIFVRGREVKALSVGCLLLYAISEFILFQPNEYDNIKLFYVAYIIMLPIGTKLLVTVYEWLKKPGAHAWINGIRRAFSVIVAWAFLFTASFSGAWTILREMISDEVIFTKCHVEAGEFIRNNTPEGSVFLSKDNHNNAANVLGGRKLVCGTTLYLYFHGVDFAQRQADMNRMLQDPEGNAHLFEKYGVDYVYISSYERSANANEGYKGADVEAFEKLYTLIYENTEMYEKVQIFAVNDKNDGIVK